MGFAWQNLKHDAECRQRRARAERANESGAFSRRDFMRSAGALGAACLTAQCLPELVGQETRPKRDKALIAITFDLEMSRNFPTWETTHWDYEKGNLDADTKAYAAEAARRAKERGGVMHFFCVGRVLEQENVDWLKELAADGHKIGNHTYDHVYVLAKKPEEIQFNSGSLARPG
jgi:hypothetical protein